MYRSQRRYGMVQLVLPYYQTQQLKYHPIQGFLEALVAPTIHAALILYYRSPDRRHALSRWNRSERYKEHILHERPAECPCIAQVRYGEIVGGISKFSAN